MATWFTSDQHFGHKNILHHCARPFPDLDRMHAELIDRHNAVVAPEDDVWHLGDFSLDERLVRGFLRRLHGTHRLVAGNHDACHPCHRRHARAAAKYVAYGFAEVHETASLGRFLLCHLPYEGDSTHEARYPEFRPKDEGRWLLHGHVHEGWRIRGRMINVGVDAWDFAPVRLETLEQLASVTTPG
jgi:calcineurin-like phosphoesterase family protein